MSTPLLPPNESSHDDVYRADTLFRAGSLEFRLAAHDAIAAARGADAGPLHAPRIQ